MKIAILASEGAPYAKSGGLGDVMEALPAALSRIEGNEVVLILPYYKKIKENAKYEVEKCIILNDCVIGKDAEVKYAILDKDVVVTAGAKLCGTKSNPIIVKKGQIV